MAMLYYAIPVPLGGAIWLCRSILRILKQLSLGFVYGCDMLCRADGLVYSCVHTSTRIALSLGVLYGCTILQLVQGLCHSMCYMALHIFTQLCYCGCVGRVIAQLAKELGS